ncbi:MAG: glycosyltransferase [Phormidesmis sp. CAN_BIN44]|nr:glycosyltransferase [Phormidesmis sp. CAN_BIN44]
MKKVSVIIPVYNVEKYIAAAVRSVLDQTYKNFELLIIDDGSPDRSIEICQQFNDSRIKIIRQLNQGLPGARNSGIRHAGGDFLAILDGDDLWLPEKLEKHVAHLENSPAVGVSYSHSSIIDEEDAPLGAYQTPGTRSVTPASLLCANSLGNGSNAVIRREVLEAIQFEDELARNGEKFYFDEHLCQFNADSTDLDCWLRIAIQTTWKFEGIPVILTLYRFNTKGLSANIYPQLQSWENVLEKTRSYAPDLVEQWEKKAKACALRYLAGRAVRLQDGQIAMDLMHRAILTYWQILLEQPSRMVMALVAAYLLRFLPRSAYQLIEIQASKSLKHIRRQRILANKI